MSTASFSLTRSRNGSTQPNANDWRAPCIHQTSLGDASAANAAQVGLDSGTPILTAASVMSSAISVCDRKRHGPVHLQIARRRTDRDGVALRVRLIEGLHIVSDAIGLFQQVLDLRIVPLDVVQHRRRKLFELLCLIDQHLSL